MASSGGIITRKEVIADDAMNWGTDYAKQTQIAIDKNKEFVQGIIQIAGIQKQIKDASTNSAYTAALQQGILLTQKTILALKEREVAEISANKIKMSNIALAEKEAKVKERATKQTIEERIQLAENNKELRNAARERLGLIGPYQKLNNARLAAQKRLGDLLSAEKKNNEEIRIAQREFEKLDARVKAVDATLKIYSKDIGNYQNAFKGLNGVMRELMSTFGLASGIALFGQILKDVFNVIKDFDRQLIAVGKTTNISGEALKQFGREVVALGDKLNGVTVEGLIKSAEVAGQLGVTGTANILKFSEAIEKLKLTSDIVSDEAVGQFAKFIEVSSDSFENADKLASVITQLGNSFATTEKEVLANATEIQKGVAVYNTSAQGVLALGAATSSLGSEAEVSASSIQKTFGVINKAIATGKNLESVLKLTGLTQAQLSKQFNQDATGVFVKFIKGLNSAKKEGQNLSVVLGGLQLDEVRSFKTIGSLAANYDLLANAMEQAKKEYEDNIALNKEVEAASESLSSLLSDIKDRWQAYILTTNDANGGTQAMSKALKFLRDNFKEIINFVVKAGTVFLTYIGVLKTVNFVIAAYPALQAAATAAQIRFAIATGYGTKSILAQAEAAKAAAIAQNGLNAAVKATPWGVVLALLSAIVVAYIVFNEQLTLAEESQKKINDVLAQQQVQAEKSRKANEDFYRSQLKGIEDVYALKKAKQGESEKLDKEEIEAKQKLTETFIDTNKEQIQANNALLSNMIITSNKKLKILEEEAIRLRAYADENAHYGNELAAQRAEKDLYNFKTQSKINQNGLRVANNQLLEENKTYGKSLEELEKQRQLKATELEVEESKKAKARRLKLLRERYELEKKSQEDLFKLQQFRLQVAMDLDEDILSNDKANYGKRLGALADYTQLASEKIRNAAEFELSQLGKYNENTGKLVRELSDLEIKTLLENGKIKKELTSGQLFILEKFQDDQKKLTQKGVKERQKIIDSEVDEVKKRIDSEVLGQDTRLQKALEAENILFNASLNRFTNLEEAQAEHERKILEIKKSFIKEGLDTQIKAIEDLIKAQDLLPENERISAEKRKQIDNDLARLKKDNSDLDVENNDAATKQKLFFEEEYFKKVEELSRELNYALQDLGNAIFESRVQNIEAAQAENDEYYGKQIELAKNDERQKDLLQKERDKKNDELEKKKRKEQQKQAVFNKALAITEAGINTAKAVTAALTAGPGVGLALAVITAAVAAVQLAAIVATPIPKYKDGLDHAKKDHIAMINDGVSSNGQYIQEVIERKNGGIEVPTGKNKIVQLYEGDTVHKSVGNYNKLQRAAMMASLNMQGRKMSDFQATQYFETAYGKEMLEEMKLTRKAIQKQKRPIVYSNNVDIPHSIWSSKNTNWN